LCGTSGEVWGVVRHFLCQQSRALRFDTGKRSVIEDIKRHKVRLFLSAAIKTINGQIDAAEIPLKQLWP
jgi:hypothetical protein